jgi:hypothetical protein
VGRRDVAPLLVALRDVAKGIVNHARCVEMRVFNERLEAEEGVIVPATVKSISVTGGAWCGPGRTGGAACRQTRSRLRCFELRSSKRIMMIAPGRLDAEDRPERGAMLTTDPGISLDPWEPARNGGIWCGGQRGDRRGDGSG